MTIFTIPAALRFYGHQLCFMGVLKTLSWQKLSATSLLVTLSPLKSSQAIPTGDPSIYDKGHFQAENCSSGSNRQLPCRLVGCANPKMLLGVMSGMFDAATLMIIVEGYCVSWHHL